LQEQFHHTFIALVLNFPQGTSLNQTQD